MLARIHSGPVVEDNKNPVAEDNMGYMHSAVDKYSGFSNAKENHKFNGCAI